MLGEKTGDSAFIKRLHDDYGITSIVLTAGENGSEWHTENEHRCFKPVGRINIVDTVGAGDAYAAIVALGYLKKWPAEKTISLASYFAAHICSLEGAIPSSDDVYNHMLNMGGGLDES